MLVLLLSFEVSSSLSFLAVVVEPCKVGSPCCARGLLSLFVPPSRHHVITSDKREKELASEDFVPETADDFERAVRVPPNWCLHAAES